jgi:4-hydroxyphenylacetate decarboxylase small subunit
MKMPEARNHFDCRNFAPVDVTKGICHRTKDPVPADEAGCDSFTVMPRCKNCASFETDAKPYRGYCTAEPGRPMTYPDLNAVTCEMYRAR